MKPKRQKTEKPKAVDESNVERDLSLRELCVPLMDVLLISAIKGLRLNRKTNGKTGGELVKLCGDTMEKVNDMIDADRLRNQ